MVVTSKHLLEARAEVFKALGHPTRLAIVDMLAGGERYVCEINQHIDSDMSTVSRHLAVLRNVGILSSDKRGNQVASNAPASRRSTAASRA
jgi:ArsR family transcriptional regulator